MSQAVASDAVLTLQPVAKEREVKVVLDMDAHHFSVMGGCNTMMGPVHIDEDDHFHVGTQKGPGLASTLMACPNELQQLDERLAKFMQGAPKVLRQGDALYLVGTIEGEKESHFLPIELDRGSYKDVEAKAYERVFYYVSSERVACEEGDEKLCLQVRQDKNDEWQIYNGTIEGFEPQPNYEYRLRLKEYNEDGNKHHVLDMVVEQGRVEMTLPEDDQASSEEESEALNVEANDEKNSVGSQEDEKVAEEDEAITESNTDATEEEIEVEESVKGEDSTKSEKAESVQEVKEELLEEVEKSVSEKIEEVTKELN